MGQTETIIFDLDSCISAADEPGRALFEPALAAIRAENRGTLSQPELEEAFIDIWRLPFDFVAKKHRFSPEMKSAGWREFARIEVPTKMQGYGDLHVLREMPVRRFLVTSGFRRLQESKIRALGIAALFEEVVIDAIDEAGARGKLAMVEELVARRGLDRARLLIVGDNADSELAAGRKLGIRTVQTLRPGVPPDPQTPVRVRDFHELRALLSGEKPG